MGCYTKSQLATLKAARIRRELESEVVQTAIAAHCRPDDVELAKAHHKAVSALIEARYQEVKTRGVA